MRNFIITMAAGLVLALTTGTVIASERERHESIGYEHADTKARFTARFRDFRRI